MLARYAGKCDLCNEKYEVKDEITKYGRYWSHSGCAEYAKNQRVVQTGESFRSQAPSTYRRRG